MFSFLFKNMKNQICHNQTPLTTANHITCSKLFVFFKNLKNQILNTLILKTPKQLSDIPKICYLNT